MDDTKLWLVIPCYNEEEILTSSAGKLKEALSSLQEKGLAGKDSKILFVDDGSRDSTWTIIESLSGEDPVFSGIHLAHNRGQQAALMAGMMYAASFCDCLITLDADLQDDISVMEDFLKYYGNGCDIVYGVRKSREKDSHAKRSSAQMFYRCMKAMGTETIYNHADYRLMSRKALEALSEYKESNLYLRGIVPSIGLSSAVVYYDRQVRSNGKTKYSFWKMMKLAMDGITSFSVRPLPLISVFGIISSILSSAGLLYALISHLLKRTVPGWTAIVCSIWLLGGIQLLGIGVVGEYIGKVYSEVKHRPRWFIDKETGPETKTEREDSSTEEE